MEYLANKPNFTLMDYKQRIEDELRKLKKDVKNKFNNQTEAQQKEL